MEIQTGERAHSLFTVRDVDGGAVYSQFSGISMAPWASGGVEERKDRGRRRRRTRGRAGEHGPLQPVHRRCDTHISQCPMKSDARHPHTHQHKKTHTLPPCAPSTLQGAPRPSGEWRRVNNCVLSWCVCVCVCMLSQSKVRLSVSFTIPAPAADCGGEEEKEGEERRGLTPRTKEGWGRRKGGHTGTEREEKKEKTSLISSNINHLRTRQILIYSNGKFVDLQIKNSQLTPGHVSAMFRINCNI